jgi:hypothetical protein
MTFGMWVCLGFGVLILIGAIIICVIDCSDGETGNGVAVLIVGLLIGLTMIIGPIIYKDAEAGARAIKDQQSNFNGGITRVVKVYNINGELIESYEGKFDIETDKASYILFDDEDGKCHIIYYTTGTIIVDEK